MTPSDRSSSGVRVIIGLRGRLVLALLAVTVVALAGAAIALFAPLDKRLRDDALSGLSATAYTTRQRVAALPDWAFEPAAASPPTTAGPPSPGAAPASRQSGPLWHLVRDLRKIGVTAVLLDRHGNAVLGRLDPDLAAGLPPSRALPYGKEVAAFVTRDGEPLARVVVRTRTESGPVTLALYRSLKDVTAARDVFVIGFLRAAAVTLAIAAGLGFLLATHLVRRTRALRAAALRVAAEGPGGEPPRDPGRDEIGDLSRAFATMQRQLRSQEEARKAFVATASHELRTPIAALQLRLGLLREDLEAGGADLIDAREQVVHSEAQASRLAKLASDLLDLSRLDAEVPLRAEPVALAEVCRATLAEFDVAAGGARVELHDAGAGIAVADPGKVAQIVRILVDNARRHAPAQSAIRVVVEGATIAVEDDGPGVPADDRAIIFDRFRRGSRNDGAPGFGLGLAIGRELARRMGGELRLRTRARPTRFELVLAAAEAEPRREPVAAG